MEKKKRFAQIFKEKRSQHRLSYRVLAKRLGVTAGILLQYEKGNSYPSLKILEKLCSLFELDLKSIYMLIQAEKAPAPIEDFFKFAQPSYPLLRKLLLEAYSEEFGKQYLSRKEAKRQFDLSPFFSIESKAYDEIYEYLVRIEIAPPNTKATDYFKTLPDKEKRKVVKDSLLGWAFSEKLDLIIFKFNNLMGGSLKRIVKKFGLGWYAYRPQYPIIRETLLSLYKKSLRYKKLQWKNAPVEKITEKLVTETAVISYHPIEKKILHEIYSHLVNMKVFKRGINPEDLFSSLLEKNQKEMIKKSIYCWTYDTKEDVLIIVFRDNKNRLYIQKFKLWHEIL